MAWVHGLITCCSFFGPFDACMESGFVYDGDALLNLFAGEHYLSRYGLVGGSGMWSVMCSLQLSKADV